MPYGKVIFDSTEHAQNAVDEIERIQGLFIGNGQNPVKVEGLRLRKRGHWRFKKPLREHWAGRVGMEKITEVSRNHTSRNAVVVSLSCLCSIYHYFCCFPSLEECVICAFSLELLTITLNNQTNLAKVSAKLAANITVH